MNLMINNYCNFKCSYCFADHEMCKHNVKNITLSDFRKFLDFERNSGRNQIRLIGGEPTLHPELETLIDMVIDERYFDSILIFSNFSFSDEIAKMFVEKSKKITISFLPNINDFKFLSPKNRVQILKNLDYLTSYLPNFRHIGINLYSPDMNLDQWEDIVTRFDIKTIRYSITMPSNFTTEDNFYKTFHDYQPLLLRLASWGPKYGIDVGNDCSNLPTCCFDDSAVSYILKSNPRMFGALYCDHGSIDLTPDLYVNGCFVCSADEPKHLSEFNNLQEIEEWAQKVHDDKYQNKITRNECLTCPRYMLTGNSCGCLIYRTIDKKEE